MLTCDFRVKILVPKDLCKVYNDLKSLKTTKNLNSDLKNLLNDQALSLCCGAKPNPKSYLLLHNWMCEY